MRGSQLCRDPGAKSCRTAGSDWIGESHGKQTASAAVCNYPAAILSRPCVSTAAWPFTILASSFKYSLKSIR